MRTPCLTIELVPSTSWFTNVRSHLPDDEWNLVRRAVYRRAGYRCEICGGHGEKHPVECHEVWSYDDQRHVQRLERLSALCPACHRVKHIGLAMVNGQENEAISQLVRVNDWTAEQARLHVKVAFSVWEERSRHDWRVDLGPLQSAAYKRWVVRQRVPERKERHGLL